MTEHGPPSAVCRQRNALPTELLDELLVEFTQPSVCRIVGSAARGGPVATGVLPLALSPGANGVKASCLCKPASVARGGGSISCQRWPAVAPLWPMSGGLAAVLAGAPLVVCSGAVLLVWAWGALRSGV